LPTIKRISATCRVVITTADHEYLEGAYKNLKNYNNPKNPNVQAVEHGY